MLRIFVVRVDASVVLSNRVGTKEYEVSNQNQY